jgi:hypothetical protein
MGMLVGGALLALVGVGLLIYSLGRFLHVPLSDDPLMALSRELDRGGLSDDIVWLTFLGVVLIGSGFTLFQRGLMRFRSTPGHSGLSDDYLSGYGRGANPTIEHTFGHESESTTAQEEPEVESGPTRSCPACGFENRDDARFCGQCGDVMPAEKVCTACDRRYPAKAMFCVTCGKRLGPPPLR